MHANVVATFTNIHMGIKLWMEPGKQRQLLGLGTEIQQIFFL